VATASGVDAAARAYTTTVRTRLPDDEEHADGGAVTVSPGVGTPFWTKPGGFAETLAEVHQLPPEEAVAHEMSLHQLPLGRLGQPDEVAAVILFLASDVASFVTSSVWGVDGGSIRGIS
jgi:NAD(P)-dependent dehydrogenase (short-subunit alcohol dehydrogenase family)